MGIRALNKVVNSNLNASDKIKQMLLLIVEDEHPNFESVSDEEHLVEDPNYLKSTKQVKCLSTNEVKQLTWETKQVEGSDPIVEFIS